MEEKQQEPVVTIVGAGPVGLALGIFLHSYEIPCQIIEAKEPHFDRPQEVKNMSKALGIHVRTVEMLKLCGLADRFINEGLKIRSLRGGLNGFTISFAPLDKETEFPYILSISQFTSESLLLEEYLKRGMKVYWNESVTDVSQDQDYVTLATKNVKDGSMKNYISSYVVACDGAHSQVRHSLNIPFEGEDIEKLFVMGDGALNVDTESFIIQPSQFNLNGVTYPTIQAMIPQPGGIYRYLAEYPYSLRNNVPDVITEEFLQGIIDHLNPGSEIKFTAPKWLAKFSIRQRLAQKYRVGRIFLAGDACHCHAPVGGQGMNTGIQDAAQLSWKLAYAIKNRVKNPEALLNSYEEERRAIGAAVVNNTGSIVKTIGTNWIDTLFSLVGSIQSFIPEKAILPILRTVSQIGIHYQSSLNFQSPITLGGFLKSPMNMTSELIGMRLNAGNRVPHCLIACQSSTEPETLYSLLEKHYTKFTLLYIGSNTTQVKELVDFLSTQKYNFIEVIAIYPTKQEAEKAISTIPEEKLYYDVQGSVNYNFYGWEIALLRPDSYIEYLQRPTEPISNCIEFISQTFST